MPSIIFVERNLCKSNLYFFLLTIQFCTLEILGNPVRNYGSDESALNERLLQIHLALDEDDENDLKQQKLSELVDDELLSYIEEHKEKFEELGAKEVRSSKLGK